MTKTKKNSNSSSKYQ